MAEQFDLDSAIVQTSIASYSIDRIDLNWTDGFIRFWISDNNGEVTKVMIVDGDDSTATASDLMRTLNKADLTTNSLHKRALNWLSNNGYINSGTVSGTPD